MLGPYDDILRSCGLVELGALLLHADNSSIAGTIGVALLGNPFIKCVCEHHPQCIFFVNGGMNWSRKWASCLRWLAAGRHCTIDEHRKDVIRIKRSFGIKAKGSKTGE